MTRDKSVLLQEAYWVMATSQETRYECPSRICRL